jgi:16S rRNA (cytidine1402-2'-O)-methyltransferase
MILYVSPHKLVKTLAKFIIYFGEPSNFSFELSKLHENVRGTVKVVAHFNKIAPRGEIVSGSQWKNNHQRT